MRDWIHVRKIGEYFHMAQNFSDFPIVIATNEEEERVKRHKENKLIKFRRAAEVGGTSISTPMKQEKCHVKV